MDRPPRRLEPMPPVQLALLGVAIVLLALVTAVAGRAGAGPSPPSPSPEVGYALIRAAVILLVIAEAVVLGLIVWAVWPSPGRPRFQARPGSVLLALASFIQTTAAIVLFWFWLHYHPRFGAGPTGIFGGLFRLSRGLPSVPDHAGAVASGPNWLTAAVVGLVLVAAAAYLVRGLGRAQKTPLRRLAEQLDAALEESLEELESESDPRRAVIAAYGRMERSLARAGAARLAHETSLEYLDRILTQVGLEPSAAARLTELFQVAKFSHHQVGEEMKIAAIEALRQVRGDLRALLAAEGSTGKVAPA